MIPDWVVREYEWCKQCEQKVVAMDGHFLCATCHAEFALSLLRMEGPGGQ